MEFNTIKIEEIYFQEGEKQRDTYLNQSNLMCIMLFVKYDTFYWNKGVNLYIQNQARLFMVDLDW